MNIGNVKQQFDAHCHIFNHDVLKIRLLAALLTLLNELDERDSARKKGSDASVQKRNLRTILEKIQVFMRVVAGSSESVFRLLNRKYHRLSDEPFNYIPLMFDSEFCITLKQQDDKTAFDGLIRQLGVKLGKSKGNVMHTILCLFAKQLRVEIARATPKLLER